MVSAGLGLGILPGEWYGPATACHVLRELNEIHCDRREQLARKRGFGGGARAADDGEDSDWDKVGDADPVCDVFRVHVATEGCIYLDAVTKLMTRRGEDLDEVGGREPPDDDFVDDPLRASMFSHGKGDPPEDVAEEWDTSLLLLLPLRLGIRSISERDYGATLARLVSLPQSVGMLGGTPRHALWFYGADEVPDPAPLAEGGDGDGDAPGWYGLDPHTVQPAPRGTRVLVRKGNAGPPAYRWQAQLTDAYLRSLHVSSDRTHPNHSRAIPLSGLDPSCALGFYLRDGADFVRLRGSLEGLARDHCRPNGLPEAVVVAERTPDYEADVGEAMRGMSGVDAEAEGDSFSMRSGDGAGELDDDDDSFVMI